MDFDTTAKMALYQQIAESACVPTAGDVARTLGKPVADVEQAFVRLQGKRLLVLEPGSRERVRMVPPFSGIPTKHVVHAFGKSYFANCAWDALGVAAALHTDADIDSTCGDCGKPMQFAVRGGKPTPQACAVHFAVAAAKWWEDIIFT